MIPPGSYNFGPSNGQMRVKVYREGFAKKAGHDLIMVVDQWNAQAQIADDPAQTSITLSAMVDSMEVREGVGGVKPLSSGDKADIKKNIQKKILDSSSYPEITFRSTSIQVMGNRATVRGDLTIMGRANPIDINLTDEGGKIKATTTVNHQSQWGIKQFTAFMGALKVRDAIEIEIEATVPH
ncbi:MAG: YceI family protein [Actinomycetota bacterium]